jgi:hypothetical protein
MKNHCFPKTKPQKPLLEFFFSNTCPVILVTLSVVETSIRLAATSSRSRNGQKKRGGVPLILSSMNLASDSCYRTFLGPDRCQHSPYLIKIIFVTLFSINFIQLCITIRMIFVHTKKVSSNSDRN